jgi:hypothetical protein
MSGEALTTQTSAMLGIRGEILIVDLEGRDAVAREHI